MLVAIIFGFVLWWIAGVSYFWFLIGDKNRKISKLQNFCETVLMLPALLTAVVIGLLSRK